MLTREQENFVSRLASVFPSVMVEQVDAEVVATCLADVSRADDDPAPRAKVVVFFVSEDAEEASAALDALTRSDSSLDDLAGGLR